MERTFTDAERGGWYQAGADQERLLVREKESHDGAEPAGSSVAVQALLRISAFTGDDRWRAAALRALQGDGPALAAAPMARAELLLGLESAQSPPREVLLTWPDGTPPPEPLLAVLRRTPLPGVALLVGPASHLARAAGVAPVAEGRGPLQGRPTGYVCEARTCRLPVHDADSLGLELISGPAGKDPGGG
jgi:uncharacterized protein YyaL (SSP411 family)